MSSHASRLPEINPEPSKERWAMRMTVASTPAEGAALRKLVANWRALIEARMSDIDLKTGQRNVFQ